MTSVPHFEPPKCRYCGTDIQKQPKWSFSGWRKRKYCSKKCEGLARPAIDADYVVTDSGCWEWQGRIDANGYGKAYDPAQPAGERVDWAHRVSYRKHRGEIPDGHELDHECENTVCINPDHLAPVTKMDHVRRTVERRGGFDRQRDAARLRSLGLTYQEIADTLGLAGSSAAHDRVKEAIRNGLVDPDEVPRVERLTEDDRESIRDLHALGVPQREISAWFDIHNSQISRIINGRSSGHAEKAS